MHVEVEVWYFAAGMCADQPALAGTSTSDKERVGSLHNGTTAHTCTGGVCLSMRGVPELIRGVPELIRI